MKLKVVQNGVYPGNPKVITQLQRGEFPPAKECRWVQVEVGQVLDGANLDKRVVKSLLANGIVEEEAGDG